MERAWPFASPDIIWQASKAGWHLIFLPRFPISVVRYIHRQRKCPAMEILSNGSTPKYRRCLYLVLLCYSTHEVVENTGREDMSLKAWRPNFTRLSPYQKVISLIGQLKSPLPSEPWNFNTISIHGFSQCHLNENKRPNKIIPVLRDPDFLK